MLKFLRGKGRRTAAIWWLVILGTAVTFIVGFSVAPNIVREREVRGSTVLGTVNGEPITQDDLQRTYEQVAQGFTAQYGRDPQDREQSLLHEQAWLQLVTEKAMLQSGRKLGYRASDAEVVFAIRNTPPPSIRTQPAFMTNGRFDEQKYFAALSDPSINWSPLEDEVRRTLPGQKLEERLLAAAKFSEPELQQAFLDQYEKARVTVARWFPSNAPVDTSKITDRELRAYYDGHRGQFSGPAEVNAVLVVVPKKSSPEDDRAALDRARSLVQQARGGADFAQLARDHSEGPTAEQGGEMGREFRLADLPPEITARAAAVTDSIVLDPVREGTKYYVVQLRRSPTPSPTPVFRMRQIVIGIRVSDTIVQQQMQQLEELREAAKKRGLGPAAARLGIAARETGWVNANSFNPELFTVPQAQQFALDSKAGTVSPVYDRDADYLLLQVKDRHEEGQRPFEQVREQAKAYVVQRERLRAPLRSAERALAAVRAGQALEVAARAESTASVEATGLFSRTQPPPQIAGSNVALGVAFGLKVGQTGGPVSTAGGVLLIRKDEFQPAPMAQYDSLKVNVARNLLSTRQNRTFTAWLDWLRKQSKLDDRRADALVVQ